MVKGRISHPASKDMESLTVDHKDKSIERRMEGKSVIDSLIDSRGDITRVSKKQV